jgi:uncharacterized repeat protein (TIGR03803 family)
MASRHSTVPRNSAAYLTLGTYFRLFRRAEESRRGRGAAVGLRRCERRIPERRPPKKDRTGALYGTTFVGGTEIVCKSGSRDVGCGVAFKLTPPATGQSEWTETILHSFGTVNEGVKPTPGLIMNARGVLFGTTSGGGTKGFGTVYELTP